MKEERGCGMRSAVGFLYSRMTRGQPQLKEEFQRRRLAGCSSLYKKDMLGHFGCVNAIEFSNNGGQWLVSGKDSPVPHGDLSNVGQLRDRPIKVDNVV